MEIGWKQDRRLKDWIALRELLIELICKTPMNELSSEDWAKASVALRALEGIA